MRTTDQSSSWAAPACSAAGCQCAAGRGKQVRALVRPGSDAARLEAAGVEIVRGDMMDRYPGRRHGRRRRGSHLGGRYTGTQGRHRETGHRRQQQPRRCRQLVGSAGSSSPASSPAPDPGSRTSGTRSSPRTGSGTGRPFVALRRVRSWTRSPVGGDPQQAPAQLVRIGAEPLTFVHTAHLAAQPR